PRVLARSPVKSVAPHHRRAANVLLASRRRSGEPVPALPDGTRGSRRPVCSRSCGAGAAVAATGTVGGLPDASPHDRAERWRSDVTLRVGIIGFGGAGQAHRFYFSCVAGCQVTKIFDPKPAAAARAASRAPEIPFFDREEPFWTDLDAVVVCTP